MIDTESALGYTNTQAFLALIRWCEGAGYHTLFGGAYAESLADHPRRAITAHLGGRKITSTAAGAYQFLEKTWDECAAALNLPDFSERSQDRAAVYLIWRRGALLSVLAADWGSAILACNREWASLPGSPYGQPTKTMDACLKFLSERLGAPTPAPTIANPPQENAVIPVPLIAALIKAAPSLISIFGNGERAAENAKAAEVVADIAKTVTGQPTVEQAVEKIQAAPEAAQAFRVAIADKWGDIIGEAGGGGIAGARVADAIATANEHAWRSPALWIAAALLPMAYLVVAAVLFGEDWSAEIKAMVVSSVLSLVLGAVSGYYLGTSYSSQRKTDMAGK